MAYDYSHLALGYFLVEWAVRLFLLFTVLPSQSGPAARPWLLFAFFAPIPALVLYLLIGRDNQPWLRQKRLDQARAIEDRLVAGFAAPSENAGRTALLADKLTGYPLTTGNHITLLPDYDPAIDRLVADIDLARNRVLIVSYIFVDDGIGNKVIDALVRAAARGVDCRVMIDALGSRRWHKSVQGKLEAGSVRVLITNLLLPGRGGTGRIDRRNHRKIYAVDDRIVYIGSQNLAARDFVPGIVNVELLARVEGPFAGCAALLATNDWLVNSGEVLDPPEPVQAIGTAAAQLVPSGPEQPRATFQLLLADLIGGAHTRILVASPYTVLDGLMLAALTAAALRGVAVTVLMSGVNDHPLVHLAQQSYIADLLDAGIAVRLHGPHLLHAKYVAIDDDHALIGSSNADIRSFRINDEAGLLTSDSATVMALWQIAERHLAASTPVDRDTWAARPRWQKLKERLANLASPLL